MITALVAVSLLGGCSRGEAPGPAREAPAATPGADDRPRVLVVGTSLTAGYGLDDPDEAYPALLQRRIDAAGLRYRVINAGVSGETSSGALGRIDWLLSEPVAVLVLETGGNDGLRGVPVETLRQNIEAILQRAQQQQPPPAVVLVGMRTLTNYGAEYGDGFAAVYPEIAAEHHLPLVPFLLDGVGGVPELNQPDGIHPTAAGHERLADNVWAVLEPVLRERERAASD